MSRFEHYNLEEIECCGADEHDEMMATSTDEVQTLVIDDTVPDFLWEENHGHGREPFRRGPVKLELQSDKRLRQRTFSRRKTTLINLAEQLAVITNSEVNLKIKSELGKIFTYDSHAAKKRDVSLQVGHSSLGPSMPMRLSPATKTVIISSPVTTKKVSHTVIAQRHANHQSSLKLPKRSGRYSAKISQLTAEAQPNTTMDKTRRPAKGNPAPYSKCNDTISSKREAMWVRCAEKGCNIFSEAKKAKTKTFLCNVHKKRKCKT